VRKLIIISLVTFLCLPLAVYASSIGGAETQGKGKVAVGLDQEIVFNRDLKFQKEDPARDYSVEEKTKIDTMSRTMVKASYGLLENLDIYVKLGGVNFKAKDDYTNTYSPTDWDNGTIKTKGKYAFAYGFGAKGTYNLKDGWLVGCDIQYLRHKNNLKATDSGVSRGINPYEFSDYRGNIISQEWQVAPYVAKKLGNFTPYLGVKYSDLREKIKVSSDDGDETKINYKAADNVGVFVGTDYKIADNWKLNLEGRFVDETAMSLGATYKF